jgi:hypothetical protein
VDDATKRLLVEARRPLGFLAFLASWPLLAWALAALRLSRTAVISVGFLYVVLPVLGLVAFRSTRTRWSKPPLDYRPPLVFTLLLGGLGVAVVGSSPATGISLLGAAAFFLALSVGLWRNARAYLRWRETHELQGRGRSRSGGKH